MKQALLFGVANVQLHGFFEEQLWHVRLQENSRLFKKPRRRFGGAGLKLIFDRAHDWLPILMRSSIQAFITDAGQQTARRDNFKGRGNAGGVRPSIS